LATTLFGPNFLFYFAILTRRSNQPDWMSPHGDIFPVSAAHLSGKIPYPPDLTARKRLAIYAAGKVTGVIRTAR
jgi:hypothetical protein